MFQSRFARGAAVLAAAALLLSACSRGGDEPTTTDPEQPAESGVTAGHFPQADDGGEPTRGGTLTFADLSEVRSLNPSQVIPTGASGGTAMVAVYDQLVRLNPETQLLEPRMAEKVEHNDDYTVWTVTMRPGIKFSDGTDVNAEAVAGSMNWFAASRGYDVAMIAPLWVGAEAVDDLSVEITLRESWATFDSMLGRSLGFIVAPAAIAGGPDAFQPIGAGAFTMGSYAPTENLILKANPNHWDGAPYLDELRFIWLANDQTREEAFNSKSVQAAYANDPEVNQRLFDNNTPRFTTLSNNGQVILLNQADGNPGSYPEVRKAMAHAIDGDAISQRVSNGAGYAGKTLFGPISKWYDDSIEVNDHDVAEASSLLEQAKANGYDGKLNLLIADSPTGREVALIMKAQFDAVGFETEIEAVRNLADYIARLYAERNYSVTPSGLSLQDYDPWVQMYVSMHSKAPSNILNSQDPEQDALLDELRSTPTEDRGAVISKIEQHYQDEVPMITWRYYTPTIYWQENVYGVIGTNETMMDFGKAWIKQ